MCSSLFVLPAVNTALAQALNSNGIHHTLQIHGAPCFMLPTPNSLLPAPFSILPAPFSLIGICGKRVTYLKVKLFPISKFIFYAYCVYIPSPFFWGGGSTFFLAHRGFILFTELDHCANSFSKLQWLPVCVWECICKPFFFFLFFLLLLLFTNIVSLIGQLQNDT